MTRKRQVALGALGILLLLGALFLFSFDVRRHLDADVHQREPVGGDFWFFWAAGRLAAEGFPLMAYVPDGMQRAMWLVGKSDLFRPTPFFYPPQYLLLLAPFGMMNFYVAYVLYFVLSLVLFLGAVWLWTRRWWTVALMTGFSSVIANMVAGQNGLYSAAFFGFALYFMARRPAAGATFIGLLTYKPQLGLLWPFVLLAERSWRPFFATIGAVGLLMLGVTLLYGPEVWLANFKAMVFAGFLLSDAGHLYERMPSLYGALRVLDVRPQNALLAQLALTLVLIYYTVRLWRVTVDPALRLALLASASVCASPYIFDYDLSLLAWPVLLIGLQPQLRWYERVLVSLGYFWPIISNHVYRMSGVQIGVFVSLLLFLMVARRILLSMERSAVSAPLPAAAVSAEAA